MKSVNILIPFLSLFGFISTLGAQNVEVQSAAKTFSVNGTVLTAKSKPSEIMAVLGPANRQLTSANKTQYVYDSAGIILEVTPENKISLRIFNAPSIRSNEPLKQFTGTLKIDGSEINAKLNLGEVKARTPDIKWVDLAGKGLMIMNKNFLIAVDSRAGKVSDVGFGFTN
jgi:hypothetical protein